MAGISEGQPIDPPGAPAPRFALPVRLLLPVILALALILALLTGRAALAQPALDPPPLPVEPTPTHAEPCPRQWPVMIAARSIAGLWRTEQDIVTAELPWQPGALVDHAAWKLGEARLWNLGLFSRVEQRLVCEGGQVRAELTLEERWTINPLFSFQALTQRRARPGETSTWWTLGASEINLGGRHIELAGLYSEFNGLPGGLIYTRLYNLGRRRIDAVVQLERLVRPRPGFDDQRTLLRGEVTRLLHSDRLRLALGLVLQHNLLEPNIDSPQQPAGEARTALAELGLRLGRVDVARIRQVGRSLELRPGLAWSDLAGRGAQVHAQLWLHALAYLAPGERWNLALRLQLAAQTQAPEHLQWYLGGLYEVRGVRDSYARGRAYALVNAEARWTLYDSTWLAVVPTLFADAAALRDSDRGPLLLASAGAGVRLLAPRFVRTGLRLDLAQPLAQMPCSGERWGPLCPGLSVGVYQYF